MTFDFIVSIVIVGGFTMIGSYLENIRDILDKINTKLVNGE